MMGRKRQFIARKMNRTYKRRRTTYAGNFPRLTGLAAQPAFRSLKGEVKSLDVGSATAVAPGGTPLTVNQTGLIGAINLVTAGSFFFNRVGRKIEMRSVELSYQITTLTATLTTPQDWLRIMIVYDRQTNGAYPAISDVLQDTDSAGANTSGVSAGLNLNNRDRFLVVYDDRTQLPAMTNTAGVVSNAFPNSFGGRNGTSTGFGNVHIFRKFKGGLVAHFKADSTPAVIGDVATGGLYVITLGTQAVGNYSITPWKFRVRYTDT